MKHHNKSTNILLDLFLVFFKLGAFSFGGGYAMLSLIEFEAVEKKKWIDKDRIAEIFAICGSLPGAIALNSAAFIGYSVARLPGALIAILANLAPSVMIVLTLNVLYSLLEQNILVQKIFLGIYPTVIGLIAYASLKIGRTAIKDKYTLIIMLATLILTVVFKTSIIILIVVGAIAGNLIMYTRNVFIRNHKAGEKNAS